MMTGSRTAAVALRPKGGKPAERAVTETDWINGHHVLLLGLPRVEVMGVIAFLALTANIASVVLLTATRRVTPMCVRYGSARAMTQSVISR